MPSPSKKRKRNDSENLAQRFRTIDSFFGNQATKRPTSNPESLRLKPQQDELPLADEELARNLQAQWDREGGNSDGNTVSADARHAQSLPESCQLSKNIQERRQRER